MPRAFPAFLRIPTTSALTMGALPLTTGIGSPFNITTTNDVNNDSIFNDRPGFVSSATCPATVNTPPSTVYCTPLGTFDAAPSAGEKIVPINYGSGPAHASVNLRLTKTFGFGPKISRPSGAPGGGPGGGGGGRGGGG